MFQAQSDGKPGKGDEKNGRKGRQGSCARSSSLAVALCHLLGVDENSSTSAVLNAQNEASGITSFQTDSAYTSLVISSKTKPRSPLLLGSLLQAGSTESDWLLFFKVPSVISS